MSQRDTWLDRGHEFALLFSVKTYLRVILATLALISCAGPALAAGKGDNKPNRKGELPQKFDNALAGKMKKAGAALHKVIITVEPGQRSTVRRAVEKRRRIRREYASLNLLLTDL